MAIIGRQAVGQLGITLIVHDVAAAANFYRDVLGAEEVDRSSAVHPGAESGPDVLSAELRLAGANLIVTRENPRWKEAPRPDWPRSPLSAGAASIFLTVYVDDADDVLAKALAAGASTTFAGQAVEDGFWGDRMAQFHDPFGHVWRVMTRLEDVVPDELPARHAAQRAAYRASRGLVA